MARDADRRRRALRELLSREIIKTEADALDGLRRRGFTVTQATISRDLTALGAHRLSTARGSRYVVRDKDNVDAVRQLALLEITSIVANESLIVIKTRVGHASGVGVFLDALENSDLLGTLAGNDTVLVIPDTHEHLLRLLAYLRGLVYGDTADDDRLNA
jgi:transcriptional regulator of arginine metabolism